MKFGKRSRLKFTDDHIRRGGRYYRGSETVSGWSNYEPMISYRSTLWKYPGKFVLFNSHRQLFSMGEI